MTLDVKKIMDEAIRESFCKGYKHAISDMRKALEEDNKLLGILKSEQKDNTAIIICDLQINENDRKLKYLDELEVIADNNLNKIEGQ